jgi:purine-binding chemotaxis protein CheW
MINAALVESALPAELGAPLLVVVFRIGGQRYALPVENVGEVVRIPALLAVAGAPPNVCGVLNLRGRHIPVLDARALVGEAPDYTLASQIVIVDERARDGGGAPRLGLLVDKVRGVQTFDAAQVEALGVELAAPFLRSILSDGAESILLMDAAGLAGLLATGAATFEQ